MKIPAVMVLALIGYAHAQVTPEFIPPTVGTCFRHEVSGGGDNRTTTVCIKEVSPSRLVLSSGTVWELPSFNVLQEARRTYLEKTGVFSTKPGCWPVGGGCGGTEAYRKQVELQLDDKVVAEGASGRTEFPRFRLVTKVIDCDVLGKTERCLSSEISAWDRLSNGNTHQVRAVRLIALTGDARGALVLNEYIQTPGFRSSARLVAVEQK